MEIPKGGRLEKGIRLVRYVAGLRIPLYASQASFFIVLSVFPLLVLLLGLLRYSGMDAGMLTDGLEGFIPEALMPYLKRLILSAYANTSGAVISISALATLWSAGRGVYGLLTGLNAIYRVPEDRGYWYTRGISALYTLLFLVVVLLTLMLNVFGSATVRLLDALWPDLLDFLDRVLGLRFLVVLLLQTVLFTAMFMALPNQRSGLRDSLPGALLASFGWLVFSDLYTVYMEHFPKYANIYGSAYAIALCMLWLYCCVSIVFYGGVLNCCLMRQSAPWDRT